MRDLYIVFILLVVFVMMGCKVEVEREEGVRGVDVVCRHPVGSLEYYRVEGVRSVYSLTKSRSALWDFRGKRVSDGKLVDVVANDCYVEREVK